MHADDPSAIEARFTSRTRAVVVVHLNGQPAGVPLPDYVQYTPGICPHAEASTKGLEGIFCHHSNTVEETRELITEIIERAEGA